MDKYEYNLKLDQLKVLSAEGNYEEAAEIADTINWNRVKNVNSLVKAGEIYEKAQRYEDSRDVLLLAYDRSPLGRMIVHHLAEIALKMDEIDEAREYLEEFERIAPHDNLKYTLRYDIRKAQGAPTKELIGILEEYKEQEYAEEWAYELAELYHQSGDAKKCVAACDELILWFGEGSYVEKAMELKMKYEPLTKAQEEKYQKFQNQREDGILEISTEDMIRAGEYGKETVEIPDLDAKPSEKFSTLNMQEEIARGIQNIMEARNMGDASEEEVEELMNDFKSVQIERAENTEEPADAAISDRTEEAPTEEEEISGLLDEAILAAAVEEITSAEANMQEAEAVVEEEIPAEEPSADEEFEETAEEMKDEPQEADDLADAIIAGIAAEFTEAGGEEEVEDMRNTGELPEISLPEDILAELAVEEEEKAAAAAKEELPEIALPDDIAAELAAEEEAAIAKEAEEAAVVLPEETEAAAVEAVKEVSEEEAVEEAAEEEAAAAEEAAEEPEAEPELTPEEKAEAARREAAEAIAMVDADTTVHEEIISEPTIRMPDLSHGLTPEAQEELKEEMEKLPSNKPEALSRLTAEMRYAFAYFIPIRGMEDQICDAVNDLSERLTSTNAAIYGNLIVTGEPGCGKTSLATTMIRVLQQHCGRPVGKVGKISAKALNNKDIAQLLRKVAGGCLIVESAGELSQRSIATLSYQMELDRSGILIVLEDTSKGIRKLMAMDEMFARKFTSRISIPIFTNDELVAFARSYSKEKGYKIDDMAVLALYNRISNIQKLDQATTLGEVKEIVDNAIAKEAKFGMRKYISILTAKRYTNDDRIVLTEKNFTL